MALVPADELADHDELHSTWNATGQVDTAGHKLVTMTDQPLTVRVEKASHCPWCGHSHPATVDEAPCQEACPACQVEASHS